MADQLPAPLTPADLDLSALEYMPLHIERLKRSATWIKTRRNPELGYYLINLWTAAFMEKPAASLPNDDVLLCEAAMCDPKRWPKVREAVMAGFILCADDRWYHRFVAEVAHDALEKRLKWRGKKRRQRGGPDGDNGGESGNVHQHVHPPVPGDTRGDTTGDMGGEKPLRDGTGREIGSLDKRERSPEPAPEQPRARPPIADAGPMPGFLRRDIAQPLPDGWQPAEATAAEVRKGRPDLTDADFTRETKAFVLHRAETAATSFNHDAAWHRWMLRARHVEENHGRTSTESPAERAERERREGITAGIAELEQRRAAGIG